MPLKRIRCPQCDRDVIVDTRELDDDDAVVVCTYCCEPIDLPDHI